MYVLVAGGGKVGSNVTRSLLEMGHEVKLIEQRPDRAARLEEEFGPIVVRGDATELYVLEQAGIARPPELLLAVTGDDEDNLVISQIGKEGYRVGKAIARVNDPRNQAHFNLLGITQTVCATTSILGLVEHEVPEHGLVRLLELRSEGLDIVEVQIAGKSPVAGSRVGGVRLPEGSRLISIFRHGRTELVDDKTVIRPGDQVLALVHRESAQELRRALIGAPADARPTPSQRRQ
jgi:trk system potassium uptake protein TrkA